MALSRSLENRRHSADVILRGEESGSRDPAGAFLALGTGCLCVVPLYDYGVPSMVIQHTITLFHRTIKNAFGCIKAENMEYRSRAAQQ